jgi:hypothetical protein
MSDYVLSSKELEKLREDASISTAIKSLADTLSGRASDVPHRFRAPAAFAQYMTDYGVNTSYVNYLNITQNNNPVQLLLTLRPTQKILELIFQGADGQRLFTLEIEYAVQEKREVLLSWRT